MNGGRLTLAPDETARDYLRRACAAPRSLGIPALGWRVYSDHSLDLHHGEGLWLHLLRLGARSPGGESSSAVAGAAYTWRPDFAEQSGSVGGDPVGAHPVPN